MSSPGNLDAAETPQAESSGRPPRPRIRRVMLGIVLGFAILPALCGIVVGSLALDPAGALAIGLALWVAMGLALWLYLRISAPEKPFPVLRFLPTIVPMGSLYAMFYVVVAAMHHR